MLCWGRGHCFYSENQLKMVLYLRQLDRKPSYWRTRLPSAAWFRWNHVWQHVQAGMCTNVFSCGHVDEFSCSQSACRYTRLIFGSSVFDSFCDASVWVCRLCVRFHSVGMQQASHSIAGHVSSMIANRLPPQSSVWKINGMLFVFLSLPLTRTHTVTRKHSNPSELCNLFSIQYIWILSPDRRDCNFELQVGP